MQYEPYQQNQPVPPPYPPPPAPGGQPPYYPTYPPPGYSQVPQPPVYYNPDLAPMPVSTSGWAIASLICSIVGFPLFGVIFGFVALGEIKNSSGRIGGEGLAKAGIIVGFILLALTIVIAVVIVLGIILSAASSNSSSFLGLR